MTKEFKYSFLRAKPMINLQPYFFFNKTDTNLCFRVFNYGLNFINRAKQPAPHSVRNGKRKQLKVYGDWYIMILKPSPKTDCVGKS